ncbi:ATP-binding protein [Polyangium jinanense]|uniref:histidine kinase n=1 Tax=Polyangium jinanense TaxID=2829994 RepID=A0A9X4B0H6_9BACT|nr:ATP-binding protein [Polyangium jinanense]MDC3989182.1 sensor histidine kinase [Polyangium jinanense]
MSARVSVPPIAVVEPGTARAAGDVPTGGQSSVRAVLASADPIPEGTAARWLIQLRWLAILGMGATTATGKWFVPDLAVTPVFLILGLLVILNGAFALVLGRIRGHEQRLVAGQITFDVLALGAVLWVTGGTGNPFAAFLVFQIALAGLLSGGRAILAIAGLTVGVGALVSFADPLPLASAPLGKERVHHLGAFVSLATVAGFLGVFLSVYARRLDELRQRSLRNDKLAMLGRVVGGMSHELSTPLATILLAGRELSELTKDVSPDASELARTIAGEAQRASDIIGLVRGYIRPDQRREEVELGKLVTEMAGRELRRLAYRGEITIDAPEPVYVTVMPAGLLQVLVNVLTNATEAMVRTARPRITIVVRDGSDHAEIVVDDSGPGFAPEILARLGEPFQTTKEREGGMGLGLYVSSVLLDRMNGTLSVDNGAEGGARVTIRLARRVASRDSEV